VLQLMSPATSSPFEVAHGEHAVGACAGKGSTRFEPQPARRAGHHDGAAGKGRVGQLTSKVARLVVVVVSHDGVLEPSVLMVIVSAATRRRVSAGQLARHLPLARMV
jgi:hypothetical protein